MKQYFPGDKVKYNGQIVTVRALHEFASGDRYFIEQADGKLAYAEPASLKPLATPRHVWEIKKFEPELQMKEPRWSIK